MFHLLEVSLDVLWKSISEFMNFNFTIVVCIESVESQLNVFFRHQFLVINSSREEFLEIDFAISIKITLFDYGFPSAIIVEGATEKTSSILDFFFA
jgi:hypothetical protein